MSQGKTSKLVLFAWIFFLLAWNGNSQAETFAGVYSGEVELTGGKTLSLDIYLDAQENLNNVNSIDTYKIVGSFVLDGEGGPYAFTKIEYHLETEKIDLYYSKTGQNNEFLLRGAYTTPFSFKGKVVSDTMGPIGQFSVTKSNTKSKLVRIPKYVGTWEGERIKIVDGEEHRDSFKLVLLPFSVSVSNPENYHFGYSLGKFGHFIIGNATPLGASIVSMDYVTSQAKISYVSSSGSSLTLDGEFSKNGRIFKGSLESTYRGNVGSFVLRKSDTH